MGIVLITGGAGFIGSHTVDALVHRGDEVRVLDSLEERVHPHGPPSWLSPHAEFIHGDASDPATLCAALTGVDRVVHLSAYQDYQPDFHRFIHSNTESVALLYEIALRERLPLKKIVVASSQSVAGEGLYVCPKHGITNPPSREQADLERGCWEIPCPECGGHMVSGLITEDVVAPGTAYAVSKHAIEQLARVLGTRYDLPTACMRYTYVQGPRNSPFNAYSGIARRFALALSSGSAPVCYEDGGQLRDFINVADVTSANLIALDHLDATGVYNVGGGMATTVLEFARLMSKEFPGSAEPTVTGQFRIGDTRHTVSDISRLGALGWAPRYTVDDNVRHYLEWFREQPVDGEWLARADAEMTRSRVVRRTVR